VEEGEQSAQGNKVHYLYRYIVGMSRDIMESLICKVVEVQVSGSLQPTIEVHILWSIYARFGNPVLSC
jgi:hypothetical protein